MREHSRIDAVASKVLEQLAEPFQLDGVSATISASIGIAVYPEGADEVEALIKQADQAMYRAKNNGKNTYAYLSDAV
jgi:diguanylate cyclase (GGDEF)-like protein